MNANRLRIHALALVLLVASCRTTCPNEGRSLAITLVVKTVGTTFGSGETTLMSDAEIDRLERQSNVGDPGVKYTSPQNMCELYEQLGALGLHKNMAPGRLSVRPGFEVRDGQTYWNYTQPARSTLEDFENFRAMMGVFLETYNSTLALQTVDEEAGRDALESTRRATIGGR